MSVTEQDRERAAELAEVAIGGAWELEFERGDHAKWPAAVDAIAAALADERERARESTLRDVADELAALMPELDWADHFREQAEAIHRAAEESQ